MTVSAPKIVTRRRTARTELDISIVPGWAASCPFANGTPTVPLFIGPKQEYRWVIAGTERLCLDLLDVPGGGMVVVDIDAFDGSRLRRLRQDRGAGRQQPLLRDEVAARMLPGPLAREARRRSRAPNERFDGRPRHSRMKHEHERRAEAEANVDQRGLVERARGGDHDAFTELVDLTIVRLDAVARLIVRDPELARDAVQDTYIRAWRDLPGLRDPDRFDAWLHRLIVHACLDLVRRRRRRVIEVDLTPIDLPAATDMAGEVADRDMLENALARLEPGHRAVVVLHYFLGMPLPEVAAAIGIPLGTAKSRLHHALATMKSAVLREPDHHQVTGRRRTSRMTSERRFDQDLPNLLAQVAQAPVPDYRDLIVQRTARMRQRPAWTFPERWLPLSAVTSRAAVAPRFPLRIVGLAVLLLIALGVGAILLAGSRPRPPAPFGPARNGLVTYASGGDIYAVDPVTGRSTVIIKGPGDIDPRWSDGRHASRLRATRCRFGPRSPVRRPS